MISEKDKTYLHSKLPIGEDEKILGVYRHHWFAYASLWAIGACIVIAIMGISIGLVVTSDGASSIGQHASQVISGAAVFSVLVMLFTGVPVWLKSQEQVVLTEEALLQILQPSLFASKISQLNLQHIADVSVRQDFFGTMFGYGKISVETPGEQDNYEFYSLSDPHSVAKEIIDAHENYDAALQAGRLKSTLGEPQQQAPQIDMAQYEQFVAFQQAQQAMVAQQAQQPQSQGQPAQQMPQYPQQAVSAQPVQPMGQPAPMPMQPPTDTVADENQNQQ